MQSPPEMKVHLSWMLLISQMSTYMCSIHKMPYVSSFSSISKSDDLCRFTLVESIPENLTFSAHSKILLSTYEAHKRLLANARISIHITSFYWTLLPTDISYHDTSSYQGKDIFNRLYSIAKGGSVDVKIAQNVSNNDTNLLASVGAQVRTLDFDQLLNAGVLHTKMWLIDNQHAYIGSANLDWRSYTQVKELGILIENCPVLCQDIAKLFEVYWYLGKKDAEVPKHWPQQFRTNFNSTTPLLVHFNDTEAPVFLSSSPPSFCPEGRSNDIDAILYVIQSAQKFIYISVMDYIPAIIYKKPYRFWPIIDDELRRALLDRRLTIYLMTGSWEHTRKEMHAYLESLAALWGTDRGDVQVKLFVVPYTPEQHKIPYARVNHCKFMVTDQHAYIGTSNWSGDYFTVTGGVGFIVQQPTWQNLEDGNLRQQLEDTFLRDWTSNYSTPIGH